jgi:hypothetical protein
MTKRRSTWLGVSGALFLVLSLSGVAAGATPPDAVPDEVVDTTATFEDIDGNGIDDDCQDVDAVLDEDAAAAELLTVDVDGNGIISTTEAAHSPRIGGKNCNHGGYVSWIAHQEVTCVVEPTEPVAEVPTEDGAVELIVAEDVVPGEDTDEDVAEPEADACADASDTDAIKTEKTAAAALRAALKAERTLARETAKAERTAAHQAAKAERTAARDASKAERAAARAAAKAERAAAKAGKNKKGH